MNNHLTPFFVLHRRPYSNTSLLLECFSADSGRFPIIAKGAAGNKHNSALLQPFQPLLGIWKGKGDVKTLHQVDTDSHLPPLTGQTLFMAMYINELLMNLLPRNDVTHEIFEYYTQLIITMRNDIDHENSIRHFEVNLLQNLGYGLSLDTLADTGQDVTTSTWYQYQAEHGVIESDDLNGLIQGHTLIALTSGLELNYDQKMQARRLMKFVINYYLEGKALKSRELFQVMRNKT